DVEKRLRQGDDENLGKEALGELLYRGHPYGRLTDGHVADLKALTLEEVKAHAARIFTVDRLTVGVAGGYPPGLSEPGAAAIAGLPRTGARSAAIAQQQPHGQRTILIEKQGEATGDTC